MRKLHKRRVVVKSNDSSILKKLFEYRVSFGLRNQSEYARAAFLVKKYRRIASESNTKKINDAKAKLKRLGILQGDKSLLELQVENFLNARLQSVVSRKYCIGMRHARNLIITGQVMVAKKTMKYPSFMPRLCNMDLITLKSNK